MNTPVRTRFAPSPTGFLHVGSVHTALFAWLFARHNRGSFVLRIEDTDVERKVEGSVEAILDGLRWLGLDWDEGPEVGGQYGPYFQSQRLEMYREAARRLVMQGDAYYCYCSPERLDEMRTEQVKRKQPPGYDRRCRDLSDKERAQQESAGVTPVVRFRTPLEGKTAFNDIIWGDVEFDNSTLDDTVLLKSDGYPTYHLANVVDDHSMEISHVIRAEEWISSTPRHILLYQAFGFQPPYFAHMPLLIGPDRRKLGKRHGAVSVLEYREMGYLPEAILNFMALLGWSLDDKTEILSREELIKSFSLERVSRNAAIFNQEKLKWMNGYYIRSLDTDDLSQRVLTFLDAGLPVEAKQPLSTEYVKQIMPLVQERIRELSEVTELTRYFFVEELDYRGDLLIGKDMDRAATAKALESAYHQLAQLATFDNDSLESLLRPLAVELGLITGQLFGVLRVAITGRTAAPPLFQTMAVLGKELCLKRIETALTKLNSVK